MTGMAKACSKCREVKPFEDFDLDKRNKSGRQSCCKDCYNAIRSGYSDDRKIAERASRKSYMLSWYENHRDEINTNRRGKPASEMEKKRTVEWQKNNKDKRSKIQKRYNENNKDKILEKAKKYRNDNREACNARVKDWTMRNKSARREYDARRSASEIMATPKWLTKEHRLQIKEVYKAAAAMAVETGIRYDVDHIVPLRGKTCCGLHVPWNLRPLPARENRIKANKLISEAMQMSGAI